MPMGPSSPASGRRGGRACKTVNEEWECQNKAESKKYKSYFLIVIGVSCEFRHMDRAEEKRV